MALERWFARGSLRLAFIAALLGCCPFPRPRRAAMAAGSFATRPAIVIEAATGRPDGEDVIVEGWTRLRPGQCRTAISGPLKAGIYFVFARSSKAHRGGQRDWSGEIPLCVDTNGSFAVENPSSCASMGLEQRGFQAVRFDKASGSMTFKETDLYNKGGQSPENAGMQRLLNDAGIFQDVVDGYLGRETRAAITDFLVERKSAAEDPDGGADRYS